MPILNIFHTIAKVTSLKQNFENKTIRWNEITLDVQIRLVMPHCTFWFRAMVGVFLHINIHATFLL